MADALLDDGLAQDGLPFFRPSRVPVPMENNDAGLHGKLERGPEGGGKRMVCRPAGLLCTVIPGPYGSPLPSSTSCSLKTRHSAFSITTIFRHPPTSSQLLQLASQTGDPLCPYRLSPSPTYASIPPAHPPRRPRRRRSDGSLLRRQLGPPPRLVGQY